MPDAATTSAAAPAGSGDRPRPAPRPARTALIAAGAVVALAALALAHISVGAATVGPGDILAHLAGNGDPQTAAVLAGSRLPRTLAGLVTGFALGVAGGLIQGSTRNPLAAPDTLGVNAGAYLGVVAVTTLGWELGGLPSGGAAFLGGLAAAGTVWLLTGGGPRTPGRVLLAGTAISLTAMSMVTVLILLNEQYAQGLFFWGNGSLLQIGLDRPATMGAIVLAGTALALPLARPLDLVSLGDDTAEALGIRAGRIRLVALALAVLLTAAAVTASGPFAFAGLLAPLACRGLGIRRHAALLPMAGLTGAAVVLAADILAQRLVGAAAGYGELPAGIVTALLGGPVFVLLARRIATGEADEGAAVTVSRPRSRRAFTVILVAAGAVGLVAAAAGLRVGDVPVSWGQLLAAAAGGGDALTDAILGYRAPRILIAALAGATLAAAGTAVQAVVRNPLAEPWLLGVTGGSALGAVAFLTVAPAGVVAAVPDAVAIPLAAQVGGVAALALVVLLARRGDRLDPTRVVLVGVGMAAMTTAVVHVLALRSQLSITAALTWMAGSTYARDLGDLPWLVPGLLMAAVLLLFARPVDLLGLGDELPRAFGLGLTRTRVLVLAGCAVLTGSAAAAVGLVGFVGLVAPHLARRLAGPATRRLLPVAMLLGATLVVAADALGRAVLAPKEIPVGIVTALVGAPYLVWLLRRAAAR